MKKIIETPYGQIRMQLFGGKHLSDDYGKGSGESDACFDNVPDWNVVINGIPYHFSFHVKYGAIGTPCNYLLYRGMPMFRWHSSYSSRQDEKKYELHNIMSDSARKKIQEECLKAFASITGEEFQEVERESFEKAIERKQGTIDGHYDAIKKLNHETKELEREMNILYPMKERIV